MSTDDNEYISPESARNLGYPVPATGKSLVEIFDQANARSPKPIIPAICPAGFDAPATSSPRESLL